MRPLGRILRIVFAAALFAALAAPTFAQRPEIEKVSAQLARLLSARREFILGKPRVAIIPFPRFHGFISELGVVFADELAQSLTKQNANFEIVDKQQLKDLVRRECLRVEQWREANVARWLAGKLGAQLVVVGTIEKSDHAFSLRVQLERTSDGKKMEEADATFSASGELESWYSSPPLEFQSASDKPGNYEEQLGGAFHAGKDGVGRPECASCPDPRYSQLARDAKFNGTMQLRITVQPDGSVSNISILRGLPFDLNQQGIKAVQQWRFRPATDRDGKPVPVEVVIDITFRLL